MKIVLNPIGSFYLSARVNKSIDFYKRNCLPFDGKNEIEKQFTLKLSQSGGGMFNLWICLYFT